MNTKRQLKEVFKGVASLLFQTTPIFPALADLPEFSASSTYAVGNKVQKDGKYYKCKTAISEAAAWDASKWDEITQNDVSAIALAPEYDMPVHVGDLSLNEGDTTVNHYKVLGDDSDWVATATKGDFDISFLVPTLHTLVMQMAYGAENVQAVGATLAANSGAGSAQTTWAGIGINVAKHEVRGTIVLLNEAKNRMLIISNAVLWAAMKFENAETDPYAVQFNGTMEATDGPDILFLKKTA